MMEYMYNSNSVEDTEKCGEELATKVLQNITNEYAFIALKGDLGAGKTAFVRGFSRVISPESRVKSPSYTIVNEYCLGDIPLYHFDLYRTGGGDELDSIGFDEYLTKGICIVEWSEYLDELPENAIIVNINKTGENTRTIVIDY